MADVALITSKLSVHSDFPKEGINFMDFLPILRDPFAFETLITHIMNHILTTTLHMTQKKKIDVVVGLDARGFLLGPIIALRLGAAFVPVRKAGKLPGKTITVVYEKEYGDDSFAIQEGSVSPGDNVVVIDDLIATGGSAKAAGDLIKQAGGRTLEYIFVIGLAFLKGHDKLDAPSYWVIEADPSGSPVDKKDSNLLSAI
ncbi:hypothetical protein BS47DRAFT_1391623 [Hydnum rufescens UP504]|uniref:adenine phosphoribosyltransferase n=1 Tax=Hydnum rufescens UP504 TaxID=1448309 RepID=A0A9P6DY92_9AGAM|nr:hypothetical protein BS47DRAFT_1391623 [Hydnum rufescens UP504]